MIFSVVPCPWRLRLANSDDLDVRGSFGFAAFFVCRAGATLAGLAATFAGLVSLADSLAGGLAGGAAAAGSASFARFFSFGGSAACSGSGASTFFLSFFFGGAAAEAAGGLSVAFFTFFFSLVEPGVAGMLLDARERVRSTGGAVQEPLRCGGPL